MSLGIPGSPVASISSGDSKGSKNELLKNG